MKARFSNSQRLKRWPKPSTFCVDMATAFAKFGQLALVFLCTHASVRQTHSQVISQFGQWFAFPQAKRYLHRLSINECSRQLPHIAFNSRQFVCFCFVCFFHLAWRCRPQMLEKTLSVTMDPEKGVYSRGRDRKDQKQFTNSVQLIGHNRLLNPTLTQLPAILEGFGNIACLQESCITLYFGGVPMRSWWVLFSWHDRNSDLRILSFCQNQRTQLSWPLRLLLFLVLSRRISSSMDVIRFVMIMKSVHATALFFSGSCSRRTISKKSKKPIPQSAAGHSILVSPSILFPTIKCTEL